MAFPPKQLAVFTTHSGRVSLNLSGGSTTTALSTSHNCDAVATLMSSVMEAPAGAGASPSPVAPSSTRSTTVSAAVAPRRWWRLYLLSPTTEMDIGAAEFSTVYPRGRSLEYLLSVAIAVYMCVYAFVTLRAFCATNLDRYIDDLLAPYEFMRDFGAIGYDHMVDLQWGGFALRYSLFLRLAALIGAGTFLLRRASPVDPELLKSEASRTLPAVPRLRGICQRLVGRRWSIPTFYAVVGFFFVAVVHGPHFFLPLVIIAANYAVFARLQRCCPYWVFMAVMWTAHVGLLYVVEVNEGFEETYWLQYFFTTSRNNALHLLGYAQEPLWRQEMRWYVAYRMTTLRLIAFNYDLWEATHCAARARERAAEKHDTTCVECAQLREQNSAAASTAALPAEASRCYKYRTEHVRDLADYGFVNYVAYVLFPPLYLAGPMSSFNAFVSYMRVPSTAMPLRKMARYALSIARIFAVGVVLLHYVHVPAVAKHSYLITEMTLTQQANYFHLSLAYLWLKFSFIWKSSRLFAMFSGIEVPEDMRRCYANTLTVRDFWRDWHASFNLWIVRYMYIPMGGRSRVALSVLPIFLFIAVWHDPALHLLKWALCIAVMFVAELVVSGCFGVASRAVSREIAAAEEGTAGGDPDGDGGAVLENAARAPHRRRLWARLARACGRRLSPRVRSWLHRQLRVLAGMSTVFGLIVANLVGFSMQKTSSVVGERRDTADVIARSFTQFTPWFAAGLVMIIYAGASLAVMDRDMVQHHAAWLKKVYGLRT